jgi:hypothetical protein
VIDALSKPHKCCDISMHLSHDAMNEYANSYNWSTIGSVSENPKKCSPYRLLERAPEDSLANHRRLSVRVLAKSRYALGFWMADAEIITKIDLWPKSPWLWILELYYICS